MGAFSACKNVNNALMSKCPHFCFSPDKPYFKIKVSVFCPITPPNPVATDFLK